MRPLQSKFCLSFGIEFSKTSHGEAYTNYWVCSTHVHRLGRVMENRFWLGKFEKRTISLIPLKKKPRNFRQNVYNNFLKLNFFNFSKSPLKT